MSVEIMGLVFDGGPTNTVERCTMLAIADHASDRGEAYPGVKLLAEKTAQTERNVLRVLDSLQRNGWLQVVTRGAKTTTLSGQVRRMNVYYLNLERLRALATQVRQEREARRGRVSLPDTRSPIAVIDQAESTTYRGIPDTKSGQLSSPPEGGAETVQELWKSCETPQPDVTTEPSTHDIGGGPDMTNSRRDMTSEGSIHDKRALLNKKNHLTQEPSTGTKDERTTTTPLPPKGGEKPPVAARVIADPHHAQAWERIRIALKSELEALADRVQGNFRPIRAGQSDYETCFAECWLAHIVQAEHGVWKFIFHANHQTATEAGLLKYGERLRRHLRDAREIHVPKSDSIRLVAVPNPYREVHAA